MTNEPLYLHATTVALDGQGVAIIGPSGSGKSALAVQLIALGATLVSDDQTVLTVKDAQVIASAPKAIGGLIEARNIGLIPTPHAGPTPVALVIDMGQTEAQRLPQKHAHVLAGQSLLCLHKVNAPHFPSAIVLYIKGIAIL